MPEISKSINCRGDLCPLPIYKASRAILEINPGEILEIICTDKGSLKDFPAFCRQAGHELVSASEKGTEQVIHIKKGST